MNSLNLSNSCITYSAERQSERVQEFLKNSIVNKSQLSMHVSLNSFEDRVPAEHIPQIMYILFFALFLLILQCNVTYCLYKREELRQYEQYCVENDQYLEADKCVKKVESLQKQEVKFSEKATKSHNKSEMAELEEINLQQFQEFNEVWDKTIEDLQKELQQKEAALIQLHENQLAQFDENRKNLVFPKTKFSPEVISLRSLLEKLNKNKRYLESHEIKKRILELEVRDEQKWIESQEKKIEVQRVQLIQKQEAELHALQTKLENQLQLKIRTRKHEMQKYAQWLQNMKQELQVTQGLELSRIMSKGEKRNTRVSGGLCNSSMLLSQNQSQLLDMSKSYALANSTTHQSPSS